MRSIRNVVFVAMLFVVVATGDATRAYQSYNTWCSWDYNCNCQGDIAESSSEQGHAWFQCPYEECGSEVCSSFSSACGAMCAGQPGSGLKEVMSYLCDAGTCQGECTCWPVAQ